MSADAHVNRTMTPTEWAMLLALSVLWGGSFFFTGIAVKELPPLTIVVLRVGLAAAILYATIRLVGVRMPRDAETWAAFVGMGLLNNAIPFCLIVWGQTHIASGLAAILNATTPLFTVVVAHVLTARRKDDAEPARGPLDRISWCCGHHRSRRTAESRQRCAGAGRGVGSGGLVCLCRRIRPALPAARRRADGRLDRTGHRLDRILLPLALLVDRPWTLPMPSAETWAAIFGTAALSTALGYILYFRILETAGATNLLLVTFLIPVSAILLGALVLGERLSPPAFSRHGADRRGTCGDRRAALG